MKQDDAVIEAMKQNGGYATLGQLYRLVETSLWKTKTPHASIRRIVQNNPVFFKIKPGLWALAEYRDELPPQIVAKPDEKPEVIEAYNHSYYQGLLLEVGNLKGFQTYVPAQDKNRLFLRKKLVDIARTTQCLPFTYPHIIQRAATIDTIWFNGRGLPHSVYEVEHSTDFQNSLLKFVELQDFVIKFYIVADEVRKRQFEQKIKATAFAPISERVQFLNYDRLSDWHQKSYELSQVEP
jgi:hypothetical protein